MCLGTRLGTCPGKGLCVPPAGTSHQHFAVSVGSAPQGVGTAGQEALGRVSFLPEPPQTESSCTMLCCLPCAPSSCTASAAEGSPPGPAVPLGQRGGPFMDGHPALGLLLGLASVSTQSQAARWVKPRKFSTRQRERTEFGCNSGWLQCRTQQSPGGDPKHALSPGQKTCL